MTRFQRALVALTTVLFTQMGTPGMVFSQTTPHAPTTASMSDGEIRKIDKEAGKITIKHGEIKSLEMPPMTMVFTAKEKSMLDKIQVGDKVKFAVVHEGGKMVVTDIVPAK
jgi:Cu/Ag efflux protein CusF